MHLHETEQNNTASKMKNWSFFNNFPRFLSINGSVFMVIQQQKGQASKSLPQMFCSSIQLLQIKSVAAGADSVRSASSHFIGF